MGCSGSAADHCCWVQGRPCTHLRDDGTDATRRWVCTLFEELQDWQRVHADPRYLVDPKPTWELDGVTDCGDWPGPDDVPCPECGLTYETAVTVDG